MTELRPAPKELAMLAAAMREDWTYDDTRSALIACSTAGWAVSRIYRETFTLLQDLGATPRDLRVAAREPAQPATPAGKGHSAEVRQLLDQARNRTAAAAARFEAEKHARTEDPGSAA